MSSLDTLIAKFEKFPGIGARQARRFAFHILTMPKEDTAELAQLITTLHDSVTECNLCHRYFAQNGTRSGVCTICADTLRDRTKLLIVERDSDIPPLERSGVYDGLYFVLGGTIPLLNTNATQKLRGGGLKQTVSERLPEGLSEIILAFSVNPDGENTERYVRTLLAEVLEGHTITISHLGRGLSTGSELEYADPETLRNALKNRQ
ncbi:MAG: toprim domain-containing protein [Candidatus Paceibacterota bacterium]